MAGHRAAQQAPTSADVQMHYADGDYEALVEHEVQPTIIERRALHFWFAGRWQTQETLS